MTKQEIIVKARELRDSLLSFFNQENWQGKWKGVAVARAKAINELHKLVEEFAASVKADHNPARHAIQDMTIDPMLDASLVIMKCDQAIKAIEDLPETAPEPEDLDLGEVIKHIGAQ